MRINTSLRPNLPKEVMSGLALVSRKLSGFSARDFVDAELFAPSAHLLKNPGKLIRPALVMLGAHVIGEDPLGYVDLAVAVELLHVSSLIHDDLIDGDRVRRGMDSVHAKYGSNAAILAGDALIAKSVGLSARFGREVMEYVSQTAMDMCAGELLGEKFERANDSPDLKTYLRIATLKSGSLLGASCSVVAKRRKMPIWRKLRKFGTDAGIAFQVRDDVLECAEGIEPIPKSNIVATLMDHATDHTRETALKKASGLNEYYVNSAKKALGESVAAGVLCPYADFIRVSVEQGRTGRLLRAYASRH
ncbi:MAG: polyprenyl synthetase family protein [Candidatus Micrarchaeota archaeon]|nr:polyprenyl synthetase family protein [Candidatus Micrarchaeota archaeon]MDE1804741.1 polyprenyl synthetase family protein [Candidatus Micrarchaeota archaeon]MDE1847008.1 polyprenyl synthetase family protein [Candidatus Micrarchaeota archaeon]